MTQINEVISSQGETCQMRHSSNLTKKSDNFMLDEEFEERKQKQKVDKQPLKKKVT